MSQVTLVRKRLSKFLALTLFMGILAALLPSRCTADPTTQIFINEIGGPVDETAGYTYSYSECHLIFLATMQVVGYPSASGATPVTDTNNNVIGYRLDLVNANNDVIGYLLYSAEPPSGGGDGK